DDGGASLRSAVDTGAVLLPRTALSRRRQLDRLQRAAGSVVLRRRPADHRLGPLHLAARACPRSRRHRRRADRELRMASSIRPIEERRLLGIGLVLLSFLLFAVIDSCAKWLSQAGMPISQVVFIRYAGQFLLITAFFLPMRGRDLLVTRRPGLEAI